MRKLIYIEAAYDFTRMPSPDRDPVKIEPPSSADLASIDARMRWFERAFGFASAAIEADARDVNLKPDGTLTMESPPPEIAAQLWKAMVSYAPRYDSISVPILAIYAVSDTHPHLRPESTSVEREHANIFWRNEWIPYQTLSIDQLLDSRGPLSIVVNAGCKVVNPYGG